jgi:hypothetical protein
MAGTKMNEMIVAQIKLLSTIVTSLINEKFEFVKTDSV